MLIYFMLYAFDSVGAISYVKSDKLGTEVRSLAVEDCDCPKGYEGLSCEVK